MAIRTTRKERILTRNRLALELLCELHGSALRGLKAGQGSASNVQKVSPGAGAT